MTRIVSRVLRLDSFLFSCLLLCLKQSKAEKERKWKMRENKKNTLFAGGIFIILFILWTILVRIVDVQPIGPNGTNVGFAAWNGWFHELTGVHMELYTITDWLGLIPVFVCMIFAGVGLKQWISRRNLFKVDYDILILGIYYAAVILNYLVFEMIPINYRPILIEGRMEVSYPSSTTLLVLCVMPTLIEQTMRRMKSKKLKQAIMYVTVWFSACMVLGRLVSGVHWFTDIVGAIILSTGLFLIYKGAILFVKKDEHE